MSYEQFGENTNKKCRCRYYKMFGVFSVVSVHFLLRNGFYQNVVQGEKMLIMVFMRCFFIIIAFVYNRENSVAIGNNIR